MPPKRKSEVLEPAVDRSADEVESEEDAVPVAAEPAVKRARKAADRVEGSSSGASMAKAAGAPKSWRDVVLDGEEEGDLPIYDDCNDIRRKIRALQKDPSFMVTSWLKEIGNVNNNSYQRFVKASGADGGASNGTYYAAYVYFEKVRIAEGKKKTAKRIRNEQQRQSGMPQEQRRGVWVRA